MVMFNTPSPWKRVILVLLIFLSMLTQCGAQRGCTRYKRARAPCKDCTYISFVRKESDCRKYSVCVNGKPFFSTMKCQQNRHWSNKRRTCVIVGSVDDDCKAKSFLKKTSWKVINKLRK